MIRNFCNLVFGLLFIAACGGGTEDSNTNAVPAPHASEAVQGLEYNPGFFDVYAGENKVLAVLPAPDEDGLALSMIYATGLTAGLGSNPIGLDRGAFDSGIILHFRKIGNRVIAEQENTRYRATADRPLEKKAVRQSFARSFLWSGSIIEVTEEGGLLIDLSSFLTRDHFGVVKSISDHPSGGSYALVANRSFPDVDAALAFPDNVELDAFLTPSSNSPGSETRATSADARDLTLIQHHSFIRLPKPGYTLRRADQRTGSINVSYYCLLYTSDAADE